MKPTSPDIPLHDIKPLVEVPDTSLYLFAGVVAAGVIAAAVLAYLLWRYLGAKQGENLHRTSLEALRAVDFADAKAAAYAITRHGRIFAGDSERHGEVFANLIARLESYKYRKSVGEVDDEAKGYYRNYLEMIDA